MKAPILSQDLFWIKNGQTVKYCPHYREGRLDSKEYAGVVCGEPWILGNPKNNRYVVRLEQMDKKYREEYGRNCIAYVSVEFIRKI